MRSFWWIAALVWISFSAASAGAYDLTTIDRKVLREPAYDATPKFCLLVFGPEAQTRVWLVLDGDSLYVDRNGNGDLTEDGERVASKNTEDGDADTDNLLFEVGDIRAGNLTHKNLYVGVRRIAHLADQFEQIKELLMVNPQARGYSLGVDVEMSGWKGAGIDGRIEQTATVGDANGLLMFADQPEDAPIVHFGGPWQVALFSPQNLTVGRSGDVVLGVGTPGLGAGTTAYVGYQGVVPGNVFPTLEITFPPARVGGTPVTEHYELKERC
ncbi:MAG: hypothetical protein KDB05_26850 [Planctomycetales bacterium]|nr:hypothetical protein [Planctomycetales bacterium]